jgi:hypothetical protein
MLVKIAFRANTRVDEPIFYCDVVQDGDLLNGSNSARFNLPTGTFEPGQEGVVEIAYDAVNLLDGEYSITAGITKDILTQIKYDARDNAAVFQVTSGIREGFGLVNLPHHWSMHKHDRELAATTRAEQVRIDASG